MLSFLLNALYSIVVVIGQDQPMMATIHLDGPDGQLIFGDDMDVTVYRSGPGQVSLRGQLLLREGDPTSQNEATTKQFVEEQVSQVQTQVDSVKTTADSALELAVSSLPLNGGTLTGKLVLSAEDPPVNDHDAASKKFVLDTVSQAVLDSSNVLLSDAVDSLSSVTAASSLAVNTVKQATDANREYVEALENMVQDLLLRVAALETVTSESASTSPSSSPSSSPSPSTTMSPTPSPSSSPVCPDHSVFLVDPFVIHRSIPLKIIIYVSGLLSKVKRVVVHNSNHSETFAQEETSFRVKNNASQFNVIQLMLPTPSFPNGLYDISFESQTCQAIGTGLLMIFDVVAIDISAVMPSSIYSKERTRLILHASTSGAPFEDGARVYLSTTREGIPLESVSFSPEDPFRLTVVLQAEAFDINAVTNATLSVVTPSGKAGILENFLRLFPYETPLINTVSPTTISGAPSIDVSGRGFDPAGHSVRFLCQRGNDLYVLEAPCNPTCGVGGTDTQFSFTGTDLPDNSACQVEITKASDGLTTVYSVVGTQNPSGKVGCLFSDSTVSLATARRSPNVFTGRVTSNQRFLYVVGGRHLCHRHHQPRHQHRGECPRRERRPSPVPGAGPLLRLGPAQRHERVRADRQVFLRDGRARRNGGADHHPAGDATGSVRRGFNQCGHRHNSQHH